MDAMQCSAIRYVSITSHSVFDKFLLYRLLVSINTIILLQLRRSLIRSSNFTLYTVAGRPAGMQGTSLSPP